MPESETPMSLITGKKHSMSKFIENNNLLREIAGNNRTYRRMVGPPMSGYNGRYLFNGRYRRPNGSRFENYIVRGGELEILSLNQLRNADPTYVIDYMKYKISKNQYIPDKFFKIDIPDEYRKAFTDKALENNNHRSFMKLYKTNYIPSNLYNFFVTQDKLVKLYGTNILNELTRTGRQQEILKLISSLLNDRNSEEVFIKFIRNNSGYNFKKLFKFNRKFPTNKDNKSLRLLNDVKNILARKRTLRKRNWVNPVQKLTPLEIQRRNTINNIISNEHVLKYVLRKNIITIKTILEWGNIMPYYKHIIPILKTKGVRYSQIPLGIATSKNMIKNIAKIFGKNTKRFSSATAASSYKSSNTKHKTI